MLNAIILAAGQGSRLRPLTEDRPKCLVELAGRSLLERQLETFAALGIERVTIIGGYRAEQLPADVRVIVNPRYESTNMVESLFCAQALMSGENDVIVSYGDIVFEPQVLARLCDSTAEVAVVVDRAWRQLWEARMEDCLRDAETLKLAEDGRIIELGKKARSFDEIQGQYIGLIKFRAGWAVHLPKIYRTLLDIHGPAAQTMYMTDFLQHLIDSGWRVQSVPVDGGWLEVDTLRDLQAYENLRRAGELARFYRLAEQG